MEPSEPRNEQMTSWWISSLAISVVCCAVLFVVFASYIVDLKSGNASTAMKVDMLEQRQKELVVSIENLQHRTMVQQIQLIPANGVTQIPLAATPALVESVNGQPAPTNPSPSPTAATRAAAVPQEPGLPPVTSPVLPPPPVALPSSK